MDSKGLKKYFHLKKDELYDGPVSLRNLKLEEIVKRYLFIEIIISVTRSINPEFLLFKLAVRLRTSEASKNLKLGGKVLT